MLPAAALLAAALSPSLTARRLLAADFDVPRREAHASGLPLAIDERGGAAPEIVFDLERLPGLPPVEAEAEYARALARAGIAAPVPFVEAEQASRQWTAQILVEAALSDARLSQALREAELRPARGAPALNDAAAFARKSEPDPGAAYRAVESAVPGTARLADVAGRLAPGELERLREALAGYDTVGVAPFEDAIKRWRESLLPR